MAKISSKMQQTAAYKYDPVMVAKFLASGTKVSPQNFQKIVKNSDVLFGNKKMSDKAKESAIKVSEDDGIKGMKGTLIKIYQFLQKTQELDLRNKEERDNFEESKEAAVEKRHSDLLKALKKLTDSIGGETIMTAEKTSASPLDIISGILDTTVLLKKGFELTKNALKVLGKTAGVLGEGAFTALESFGTALGSTAVGASVVPVAAVAGLAYLGAKEKEKIETNPNAPEYKDNPYAMVLRGEAKSVTEATKINQSRALKGKTREYIKQLVDSGLSDDVLKQETGADKATLMNWLKANPKSGTLFEQSSNQGISVPSGVSAEVAAQSRSDFAKTDPRLISNQSTQQDLGQKLNATVKENLDSSLPSVPVNTNNTIVNNNLRKSLNGSQNSRLDKLSEISVRNNEPVFQKMIMDSIRLV